jgi:SAM-dependent methyltransferase
VSSRCGLICLECDQALKLRGTDYFCPRCDKVIPTMHGILSFVESDLSEYGYKKDFFPCLDRVESNHFWFKSRNKMILQFLRKYGQRIFNNVHRMLEIGCGNGNVLRYLRKQGINCEGGDVFLESLVHCRKKDNAPLYQIDASRLPFSNYFDIIGIFDVIEHIEDDKKVFAEIYKALKIGGMVILTAPAGKRLWGKYDEVAFHKRRYSKNELIAKLESAGFIVERITHFVFLLFPVLWLFRRINEKMYKKLNREEYLNKELHVHPFFNRIFFWILEIERKIIRFMNVPFGSSLIAVAKKEGV